MLRQAGAVLAAAIVLSGCSGDEGNQALPGDPGDSVPSTASGSAPPTPSGSAPAGPGQLTRGSVRLTVRPEDAARRDVLDTYLGFFAAYSDALARGDAKSAELRRRTTPAAFADFSRGVAGNAREGVTVRGPLELRPELSKAGPASVTVVVVDCLDASGQKFYDRSNRPTGQAGRRRPVQVQLRQVPSEVRYVVSSISAGPAGACERSGS